MKLYLAGESPIKNGAYMRQFLTHGSTDYDGCPYRQGLQPSMLSILESFFYLRKNKKFIPYLSKIGSILLDSGAFTFMQSSKKHRNSDWLSYADEYADFVKANNIKLYLELDIDAIVGLQEVEKLRERIEARVGWQCIPVWHTERGKQYFEDMCRDYKYVALGSIAKVIPPKKPVIPRYFPWFIQTAHRHGAKIHALGYTSISGIKQYRFDSVDSTAWLFGNWGGVYRFDNQEGTIETLTAQPQHRISNPMGLLIHNFNEWTKFQEYAENNI